jgi:hypothetical protein
LRDSSLLLGDAWGSVSVKLGFFEKLQTFFKKPGLKRVGFFYWQRKHTTAKPSKWHKDSPVKSPKHRRENLRALRVKSEKMGIFFGL